MSVQNMETLILHIYRSGQNTIWKKKKKKRENTSLFFRCGIVEGHSHKNICAEKKYDNNILLKTP